LATREHFDVQHKNEMADRKFVYIVGKSHRVREVICFNDDRLVFMHAI
jgi:hypothetical protein